MIVSVRYASPMSQDETTIRAHVEANFTAWYEKIRREYPMLAETGAPGTRLPPPGILDESALRGHVVMLLRNILATGTWRRTPDDVAAFVSNDRSVCAIDLPNGRIVIDVLKIVRWLEYDTSSVTCFTV